MDFTDINCLDDFITKIKKYDDLHIEDECCNNTYLLAVQNGHLDIMKYLESEYHWNLYLKNLFGYDAYLLAVVNGHLHILKYLETEYDWNINVKEYKHGRNAYMLAAMHNHLDIMEYLELKMLKQNNKITLKIDDTDNYGYTAFLCSIKFGHTDVMMHLEHIGADIYLKNNFKLNAYLIAAKHGRLEVIKYLENETDIDILTRDVKGYDAYLYAGCGNHVKIIKHLDDFNWNPDTKNKLGQNIMMLASGNNSYDVIKYVLDRDNIPNNSV